jgi:hypothetical protein
MKFRAGGEPRVGKCVNLALNEDSIALQLPLRLPMQFNLGVELYNARAELWDGHR